VKHVELRLAGEGGQGLILAAVILAEAASVYDGLNAVQTQSYGPESRGGASKAEVIIADTEIDYPKVQLPDITLVMSQEAASKYSSSIKDEGTLLVDSSRVKNVPEVSANVIRAPITKIARDDLGREIVANIVGLGLLVGVTGVVTRDALFRAVMARVPKGTEDLNSRALELGFEVAAQRMKQAE